MVFIILLRARQMLLSFILLQLVNAATVCPRSEEYCVTYSSSCFTIHSAFRGWAGFGIGERMAGADIYVAWKNSTDGFTLSTRKGTGHSLPGIKASRTSSFSVTDKPSWALTSFAFCNPDIQLSANKMYIYAGDDSIPSGNIDSESASFGYHSTAFGIFSFDFTSSSGTPTIVDSASNGAYLQPSSSFPKKSILILHGVLMGIAWLISPFIGIYVARYMKTSLGQKWYAIHVFFMFVLTIISSLISFIIVTLYRIPPHYSGETGVERGHTIIGLLVVIGMIGQGFLGFICDRYFNPERESIPWFQFID